ncbi:MAG: IPT/TIG domain-containing protein [Gemmatimonadota bacterium]
MSRSRACWVAVLTLLNGCGPGTAEVLIPPVEIEIAGGDDQFGTVDQTLPVPLQVSLTSLRTGLPVENAIVEFRVEQGGAEIVGNANVSSDERGSAVATVRLGSAIGVILVRATVRGQEGATVLFQLESVDRPELDSVSPSAATPGETVVLQGRNFSPNAEQNVVLFSGIRGRVIAATRTSITVEVPACLPARAVSVTTQLGVVASSGQPLTLIEAGPIETLPVGGVLDVDDPEGFACPTLPGYTDAQYLVMVQSGSSIGAAAHPFTFTLLDDTGPTPAQLRLAEAPRSVTRESTVHARFERRLRAFEDERVRARPLGPPHARSVGPQPVPTVGERRDFFVYRNPGDFAEVSAVARFVGERAAFFVDEDAPAGGYTAEDLQAFSDQFDDVIYPTVTDRFGTPSDLDANQRIVVLFTPVVNAMTARGATGFVGGFFIGVDLLPDENGSNGAEVFYTLAPDPNGDFSDPRPKDRLQAVTPAILAHEFQHMVNFNERVLQRGGEGNDAVWLSEGLAQFAEEAVARAYDERGDDEAAALFRVGAIERARRYMAGPDTVSLLVSFGSGTLSERGGGFLHVLYLEDHFGEGIVRDLTQTTRTGVANVEAETGTSWPDLLSDWWTALWLDGPSPIPGPRDYPSVDLREYLGSPYPLEPEEIGGSDTEVSGSLRSAAVRYYIVTPGQGGSTTLRLGGQGGGASLPLAGMRLRIVRIQ